MRFSSKIPNNISYSQEINLGLLPTKSGQNFQKCRLFTLESEKSLSLIGGKKKYRIEQNRIECEIRLKEFFRVANTKE